MKPYMIIEGSSQAVDLFEKKVAEALEQGYSLAGELVAKTQASDVKFYQPVILSEDDEDDEEDWDDEDEEEDEDEE